MIDKKSIEVYKSIKAPDSIKERIQFFESEACKVQDCQETGVRKQSLVRTFRPVIGLAACLTLVVGIAMPLANSQAGDDIFINGTKVGKNPICISKQGEDKVATARMMDLITVPINLNQEDAEMSVTSGNLQLLADSGEVVEEAPTIQKEDGQSVYWILDGLEFDEPVLTVKTKECKMTYQAYKEDTSGLYYITLKGKVNLQ